jgi:hypothetical protein
MIPVESIEDLMAAAEIHVYRRKAEYPPSEYKSALRRRGWRRCNEEGSLPAQDRVFAMDRAVEVTIKELKSGLHLGQMQVTKEKERVERAIRLPVMAYLLLLRLYGKELDPEQGITIFQLKQRFCDEAWQEQLNRSETKWRKKLDQYRAAA